MKKTLAQEALEIMENIPAEDFIIDRYTTYNGKCCVLGHWYRVKTGSPTNEYSNKDTEDIRLRKISVDFLQKKHGLNVDIAEINNNPIYNGYTEPKVKDRVVHVLKDMVEAGY